MFFFNDTLFLIDSFVDIRYNIAMSEKVVICIILYHGTIDKYADDIITNGINLSKSKHSLDFGPGFYTTEDLKFAENTAKFRMKRYNFFHQDHKVSWKVVKIVCDDEKFENLLLKSFYSPDAEWGKFIIANRCENKNVHHTYNNNIDKRYDVVSGPTADGNGSLTPIIAEVNEGKKSLEEIDYLSFAPSRSNNWGNQISFHTTKSLSCITDISVL